MKKILISLILILAAANSYSQGNVFTIPGPNINGIISNGSNTTFTTPVLLPNGTSSAPSLAFSSDPDTGIYWSGIGNLGGFTANGAIAYTWGTTGLHIRDGMYYFLGNNDDVAITRDAANTLALRNSTNTQAFNIYNTYTDASNYQRLAIKFVSGVARLVSESAGTGGAFNIGVAPAGQFYVTAMTPDVADSGSVGVNGLGYATAYFIRSIQGSKNKVLTDAGAAVAVWTCAIPSNDFLGGDLIWSAKSTDGTDLRVTTGKQRFTGVNKAGTVTCGTMAAVGTDQTASSNANTLACTWSAAVNTTNCDLKVTCTDNTAGTQTMSMNSRLDMPIPQTCTPQ